MALDLQFPVNWWNWECRSSRGEWRSGRWAFPANHLKHEKGEISRIPKRMSHRTNINVQEEKREQKKKKKKKEMKGKRKDK